jgi:SOS-response transcriptional repressor LexA
MIGLTPMQAKALKAVAHLTSELGVAPSYSELCQELGLVSKGGVMRLLYALRERGAVEFIPQKARSVRIIADMPGLETRSTTDLQALRREIDRILRSRAS